MTRPTHPEKPVTAEAAAERWARAEPPPLPEAGAHEDARASLRRMTLTEQRAALVSAGIYEQDGTLTANYRGGSD
jgi:hypothetical protein